MKRVLYLFILLLLFFTLNCKKKEPPKPKEVDDFSCDTLERVLSREYLLLDKDISFDGKGSIRIETKEPMTITFYETKVPGENATFTYKIKMKTKGLKDSAYVTMDLYYPNGGKQSVQLDQKYWLYGDNDWTDVNISIPAPNQKVASVILNIVLTDEGTVWVDDLHLIMTPFS